MLVHHRLPKNIITSRKMSSAHSPSRRGFLFNHLQFDLPKGALQSFQSKKQWAFLFHMYPRWCWFHFIQKKATFSVKLKSNASILCFSRGVLNTTQMWLVCSVQLFTRIYEPKHGLSNISTRPQRQLHTSKLKAFYTNARSIVNKFFFWYFYLLFTI